MEGVVSFFQAALDLIGSVFDKLLAWLADLLGLAWGAFTSLLVAVLTWLLDLLVFILNGIVDLFFLFLMFLARLLPPVPDPPTWYVGALAPYLGILNSFFPVAEVLTVASTWATIYGLVFLYKAIKFVRGGG